MNNTRFHYLTLSFLHPLSPLKARELLAFFDNDIEAMLNPVRLSQVPNIRPDLPALLQSGQPWRQAEEELRFIEQRKLDFCCLADEDYPRRLATCPDAPLVLYRKGPCNLDARRIVSIVGTRRLTAYGRQQTEKLVAGLASACPDLLVVSGLASGIDGCAHRAALDNGLHTVGVLAHGLDQIYPAQHWRLAGEMVGQGALLSEFPHGTSPIAANFVRRNRIVAGLCDACIVIESAEKGGSLITARLARDYDREVFALPGRNIDPCSRGCNWLIKKQIAALFETADDLLREMNWDLKRPRKASQPSLFPTLEPALAEVLALMKEGQDYNLEELMVLREQSRQKKGESPAKNNIGELLGQMMQLELAGAVVSLSGGRYRLA